MKILDKIKILNANHLKIIAYLTMLIDHIGAVVVYNMLFNYDNLSINIGYEELGNIYDTFRYIGRIAFPIFAFQISEGFVHTSSQKRYIIRLVILALVSEIPFDLAFAGEPFYFSYQNVIFTLLLGLLAIVIGSKTINYILKAFVLVAFMGLANFMKTDYGMYGVFLVYIYYFFKNGNIFNYLFFMLVIISHDPRAAWAIIPIFMYNGKKGMGNTRLWYSFYPLHLLILFLIGKIYTF